MRKRFLIKPMFQLRTLFWTLGIVVLSLVIGYFIFESIVSAALIKGPVGQPEWLVLRSTLRWGFAVALFIMLAAIGIESYFFTHSIAGPLYALERGLRRLGQGDFNDVTRIREGDQLGELIGAFEDVKKKILVRLETQENTVQRLAKELDRLLLTASNENLDEIRSKLKEIRSHVEKKAA